MSKALLNIDCNQKTGITVGNLLPQVGSSKFKYQYQNKPPQNRKFIATAFKATLPIDFDQSNSINTVSTFKFAFISLPLQTPW